MEGLGGRKEGGRRKREREREREKERERERERERQTDRQTDRQRERKTDRQSEQEGRGTDIHTVLYEFEVSIKSEAISLKRRSLRPLITMSYSLHQEKDKTE